MNYESFLESKLIADTQSGFMVDPGSLHEKLFPHQDLIVRWALQKGRSACFADCGLGKGGIQIIWADQVMRRLNRSVLILAPLAVAQQTVREARDLWGVDIKYVSTKMPSEVGIYITNYERLHHFDRSQFSGIALDESGILKGFDGVYRKAITDFASQIPFRICLTATPAPNDLVEIVNHAEFLGIMKGKIVQDVFFTQDGNSTQKKRLKGHAKEEFYTWLATWSVAMRKPSDLGFSDEGFNLPPLQYHEIIVDIDDPKPGNLFSVEALTMSERLTARRDSTAERVAETAKAVNALDDFALVFCNLNAEGAALKKAIHGAVEVKGSDSPDFKAKAMMDFADGKIKTLISKASICGHGMNFQHCNQVFYVGLSDSFEERYQSTRRCHRFGQKRRVHVTIVTASTEGRVLANQERKERDRDEMMDKSIAAVRDRQLTGMTRREYVEYKPINKMIIPTWLKEVA